MRIERKGSLAWRRIGDETIIVHLERKRMYCLNEAGSAAWERLERPSTVEDVARASGDGATDAEAARRFVAQLVEEQLVIADGPGDVAPGVGSEVPGPRIVWSEPIERFAGLCAFRSGQDLSCNQNPFGS